MALKYKGLIKEFRTVETFNHDYGEICPHIFPVKIKESKRSSLIAALEAEEVEYGFHYKPNHLLSYFKKNDLELRKSEALWRQMLTLPLHVDLNSADVEFVCKVIERTIEDA